MLPFFWVLDSKIQPATQGVIQFQTLLFPESVHWNRGKISVSWSCNKDLGFITHPPDCSGKQITLSPPPFLGGL